MNFIRSAWQWIKSFFSNPEPPKSIPSVQAEYPSPSALKKIVERAKVRAYTAARYWRQTPCKYCKQPMNVAPGQIQFYHGACREYGRQKFGALKW